MRSKRTAVWTAIAAVAALWIWQYSTVHANYGGNWTGLFLIGDRTPVPPALRHEGFDAFPDSFGYDGQFYHLMAHDPWMRHGSDQAIASPAFRFRRILVPAISWALAFGQAEWIHRSYFAVILGFAFLGVYWTARFAERLGFSALWGLLFVLTPASISSMDRMTVDIALAAFTAGFALHSRASQWRPMFLLLAMAGLVRETGMLLAIGYAIFLLSRRQFGKAMVAAASLLPTVAWYAWLLDHWEGLEPSAYLGWIPLKGFAIRVIHPHHYVLPEWKAVLSVASDYLGLIAIGMVLILTAWAAMKRRWTPIWAAVYVFALFLCFVHSEDVWSEIYAYGRVFTPMVMLAGFETARGSPLLAILPTLLFVPNMAFGLWRQIAGVLRIL